LIRTAERQLRTPSWGPPLLHAFGTSLSFRRGRWDDALAESTASRDASGTDVHVTSFYSPQAFVAIVTAARAGRSAGRAALHGGEPLPPFPDDRVWSALAHTLTSPDDGSQAAETLDLIVGCVETNVARRSPAHLLCGGPDLAWFAARHGRVDVAEAIGQQLSQLDGSSPYVAASRRWAAGVASASAPPVARAARELAALGYVTDATRAGHHAAFLLAQSGAAAEAASMARWAIGCGQELGAEVWEAELRRELRTLGVAWPRLATARPARFGWDSLTRSEHRVVELLAEGHTNAEIGTRLAVSRRTVEAHLRSVYTKVGLSTRPQLLRAALERVRPVGAEPR
jgi:DNA-binding CsgD family transcriptional regulator